MSLRHVSRPSDRDIRMHDPPPHIHPVHTNGVSASTPALPNGTVHVSPTVAPPNGPNGVMAPPTMIQKLNAANEQTWLLIGRVAEQMGDLEHALNAYENALRHNPVSLSGLTQVAGIARIKENYPKAIEFFQRVLNLQEENGEVWSALGHCYLMQDDLQKAYSAYQQALYLLPNPKEDPKLWYGIGILYDRYGSLDHAEEAFSSVLRMDKDLDFDKANEILFRLGIIYKQQGKYEDSLNCFDRILRNPPSPLAHADIWFQIGHVYEQQKDYVRAKDAYERVVLDNPSHAKVLQQLGWLYHQDGSSFQNQETAIQYLTKSLEADSSDAQSWYLLGRAYMAGQKYNKAYEAYQQAVYRDGRNPTFWCSIGVLYFQINQFRDALDAYSRAIRINPYISEVWFDLGSLYESCNNQISDAIDAYARASELDPNNTVISSRLQLLKNAQTTGVALPAAPGPQDVHPTAYASAVVPPPGLNGPPLLLQPSQRPQFRADSRGPPSEISLPPPAQTATRSPPGPFRGGPPPPVNIDERHHPSHPQLAPMEVDRPPINHPRDFPPPGRESRGGPMGHQSLLLHHPSPQSQTPADEMRGRHPDPYFRRMASRSNSPPPRGRSPPFQKLSSRPSIGPGQPLPTRSPRTYPGYEPSRPEPEAWERRPPTGDHRREDWDRRPARNNSDYPPSGPSNFPARSPVYSHRVASPTEPSPRSAHPSSRHWENPSSSRHSRPPSSPPPQIEQSSRSRYDPCYDARDVREIEPPRGRGYPEELARRESSRPPPPSSMPSYRNSESPLPSSDSGKGRRRVTKEMEVTMQMQDVKKDKKKKSAKRRDEPDPKTPGGSYRLHPYKNGSPGPSSSNGSGSSARPSPTSANTPRPPSRTIDEDYDEGVGVADTLLGLAASGGPANSPTVSAGSRHSDPSSRPPVSHRDSISSNRSHMSPPPQPPLKRPLSPGPEETETKRSRVDSVKRRASSPAPGRRTPTQSTRPSPIPFRTQPTSHSPEARHDPYPSSPPLAAVPTVLPPHPRPLGAAGMSSHSNGNNGSNIALPPIATLSPTSTASPVAGPGGNERERDRDRDRSRYPPLLVPASFKAG
ncbi:glucose repression mediator protein, variant 2 [Stygiomarasmius scandens]|uniref:Glucose repression mediator protein, variant 2 n=1 Tax=Marasmiellus scandens TaxID=2682957 RepID=A0ABR1JVR5_9AGAR